MAISFILSVPSGARSTSRTRNQANSSAANEMRRITHKALFSNEPNTALMGPPSWATQPAIEPPCVGTTIVGGKRRPGLSGTGEGYRSPYGADLRRCRSTAGVQGGSVDDRPRKTGTAADPADDDRQAARRATRRRATPGRPANVVDATNRLTVNGAPAARAAPDQRAPVERRPGGAPGRPPREEAPARDAEQFADRGAAATSATISSTAASSDHATEVDRTPAFASAKAGRTKRLTHGKSACSIRASGDTASVDRRDSSSQRPASASGGSGSSLVSSAIRRAAALTAAGRWNGRAGARTPKAAPASAGWTPPPYANTQISAPRAMYGARERTCSRSSPNIAPTQTSRAEERKRRKGLRRRRGRPPRRSAGRPRSRA